MTRFYPSLFIVSFLASGVCLSRDLPTSAEAITAFLKDKQVTAKILSYKQSGFSKAADAGAVAYSLNFGDEGYLAQYVVSYPIEKIIKPLERSKNPVEHVFHIITAKVSLGSQGDLEHDSRVELIDSENLETALKNLK